jgi:hypothetical protein
MCVLFCLSQVVCVDDHLIRVDRLHVAIFANIHQLGLFLVLHGVHKIVAVQESHSALENGLRGGTRTYHSRQNCIFSVLMRS